MRRRCGWRGMATCLALGLGLGLALGLGLLVSAGINQLGVLQPPWPLVFGMGVASGLWHLGARIGSADASAGFVTIGLAMAIVFVPWLLFLGVRMLWRWQRRRR